jgi:hypothetical protein
MFSSSAIKLNKHSYINFPSLKAHELVATKRGNINKSALIADSFDLI